MQKLKTSTRREKVERREEAIVAAARRMFLARGFARTTMAEIARQAGVADGTIYLYFKNKEDLARAVVADFYRRLTESAQAGVDALSTTRERLHFLARHHMQNVMDERRILEMLPVINADIDSYSESELFELNKNYVVVFDRIAKNGQSAGEIKPNLTPWILRDIFFGAMDYGFKTMMIKNRRKDIDQFADELLDLILADKAATMPKDDIMSRLESVADRMEAALKGKA